MSTRLILLNVLWIDDTNTFPQQEQPVIWLNKNEKKNNIA